MSNKKVLLLALICGLLTAVAVNYYLQSIRESAANIKTRKVAVAAVRIPMRTLVTADMVALKDVPVDLVHSSAITDTGRVVGTTTRAEIEAGEQILTTKLVPKDSSGTSLAYSVPLGMRAISVIVNEQTGVSGLLTPGDRVDVFGTLEGEVSGTNPNAGPVRSVRTYLILQNIEVLAVGKNYTAPGAQQGDKKDQNQGGSTVTLAVPADKAQALVLLSDKGKPTLALRSPADKSKEKRLPVDMEQVLKSAEVVTWP